MTNPPAQPATELPIGVRLLHKQLRQHLEQNADFIRRLSQFEKGPRAVAAAPAGGAALAEDPAVPTADDATFEIHFNGRSCKLGYTLPYRIFARLAQQPGRFISVNTITEDVWGPGAMIEAGAVKRHKARLCRKLVDAGMPKVAQMIVADRGHYALKMGP